MSFWFFLAFGAIAQLDDDRRGARLPVLFVWTLFALTELLHGRQNLLGNLTTAAIAFLAIIAGAIAAEGIGRAWSRRRR